jgi:hypothetical protein
MDPAKIFKIVIKTIKGKGLLGDTLKSGIILN